MRGSSRILSLRRRAWSSVARVGAAVIATSAVALAAVACSSPSATGSGHHPGTGGSASTRSTVSFATCMRSHGVPNYPDPGSGGTLQKTSAQRLGVSSSDFSTAQRSCQHLLPATGTSLTASSLQQCYLAEVCPQALVQQAMSAGLRFAQCMRTHGAPNWPDPSIDAEGRPLFNINVPRPAPPQVSNAINECTRVEHPGSLLAWG
jgi:hypothetical protein